MGFSLPWRSVCLEDHKSKKKLSSLADSVDDPAHKWRTPIQHRRDLMPPSGRKRARVAAELDGAGGCVEHEGDAARIAGDQSQTVTCIDETASCDHLVAQSVRGTTADCA